MAHAAAVCCSGESALGDSTVAELTAEEECKEEEKEEEELMLLRSFCAAISLSTAADATAVKENAAAADAE